MQSVSGQCVCACMFSLDQNLAKQEALGGGCRIRVDIEHDHLHYDHFMELRSIEQSVKQVPSNSK